MVKALMIIANGSEEMETVITADVLRRAEWQLDIASPTLPSVTGTHKIRIMPDIALNQVNPNEYDILVLPGGLQGTRTLSATQAVIDIVRSMYSANKLVCAMCAAPVILQAAGILKGVSITLHPSMEPEIKDAVLTGKRVEKDGNIITAVGPGATFEFALAIVASVDGEEKAKRLADDMLLPQ